MKEEDSKGRVIGFQQPGADRRIREAAEAGLKAVFPLLIDRHGRLNQFDIDGAFCAMIRGHFEYMARQEGVAQARQLCGQFETTLHDTLSDMLTEISADGPEP